MRTWRWSVFARWWAGCRHLWEIVMSGAKPPRHLAVMALLTGMRRAIGAKQSETGLTCETKKSFGMKKILLLHPSLWGCKSSSPEPGLGGKRGTMLGSRYWDAADTEWMKLGGFGQQRVQILLLPPALGVVQACYDLAGICFVQILEIRQPQHIWTRSTWETCHI